MLNLLSRRRGGIVRTFRGRTFSKPKPMPPNEQFFPNPSLVPTGDLVWFDLQFGVQSLTPGNVDMPNFLYWEKYFIGPDTFVRPVNRTDPADPVPATPFTLAQVSRALYEALSLSFTAEMPEYEALVTGPHPTDLGHQYGHIKRVGEAVVPWL